MPSVSTRSRRSRSILRSRCSSRARGRRRNRPTPRTAVAAICRRLDGLPLALELAAARLRLLSPEALLERLDHALDVLTSGRRDAHERQQTLRATIDWSHSLLSEPEQRLFRRMAVFAGGCTLADVEAVCADPGATCLDELESLVDKALVQVDGQSGRLRMLQTIAEFARGAARPRRRGGRDRGEARTPLRGGRPRDSRCDRGHRTRSGPWSAASPRKATSRRRSRRSSPGPGR